MIIKKYNVGIVSFGYKAKEVKILKKKWHGLNTRQSTTSCSFVDNENSYFCSCLVADFNVLVP